MATITTRDGTQIYYKDLGRGQPWFLTTAGDGPTEVTMRNLMGRRP